MRVGVGKVCCVWLGGRRFCAVVASILVNAGFSLLREHLGFRCYTGQRRFYRRALFNGPVAVLGDYFSLDAWRSVGETAAGSGKGNFSFCNRSIFCLL